jgi:hypothetical protein
MKRYITFPKGTAAETLSDVRGRIAGWHIVRGVTLEGLTIQWEQSLGYGPGAESLSAFVEGLMLGFSIGQPKKLISTGIDRGRP